MVLTMSITKVGLGRNTLIQHSHLSSTPYKEVLDTHTLEWQPLVQELIPSW
jgi:hypothetical protein